jgi:hypothetical protein
MPDSAVELMSRNRGFARLNWKLGGFERFLSPMRLPISPLPHVPSVSVTSDFKSYGPADAPHRTPSFDPGNHEAWQKWVAGFRHNDIMTAHGAS